MLLSASSLPLTVKANSVDLRTNDLTPKSSQIIPRTIRVAIYNEPNVTQPGYTSGNTFTNNYTALILLLESAGVEVTELTGADIYNHKLTTADFDVFILVDNVPRENITNNVKEFWLGGGGILSFDSALPYLCYAGIIIPESEGDDGRLTYWTYQSGIDHNVSTRHPITKDYQVNDKYSTGIWMNYFYWSVVQGTSVGSEIVKLTNRDGNDDYATAVALRRSDMGGPIVHLPGTADIIGINMSSLITNAIDWLCPRPKGRIVYDLSHNPRLGVDNWDDLTAYPGYYEEWRNEIVSRNYLFDKLYPSSSGNFTLSRLNSYDLLVVVSPDTNISASEATTVSNWINNGGSLLALGDNPTAANFDLTDQEINKLLTGRDLTLNLIFGAAGNDDLTPVSHPTIEGCNDLEMGSRGAINLTGDARSLWELGGNVHIACQDTGNGRIIVSNDMNWLADTNIGNQENRQFSINIVNWLTSDDAEVLLYVDEPDSPNYYITPVSNALNELGLNFYLTFDTDYLNLSLNLNNWELLIIDNPWPPLGDSTLTTVNNFVKDGGWLIMSTYTVSLDPTHSLWSRLGFEYDQAQPGSSSLYIWNAAHPIFNFPVDYGAARFDPIRDYGDEGDLLRVYPNATSLAGYTVSETENNTNIVLANGGKTLFNGYLIDQFTGDYDDSAYTDNFELWINEITFMWAQIVAEPVIDGGIPGYDVYLVSFAAVFSIGIITIITLRKKRKN